MKHENSELINQNARDAAAAQLTSARKYEQSTPPSQRYPMDRPAKNYLMQLMGLQHFFNYVGNLSAPVMVDVGSGTTRGMADFKRSQLWPQVRFQATVLSYQPEIATLLGWKDTHITSAEVMRPYGPETVGGFLGLFSLFYSQAPDLVAQTLWKLLIPGGVVKTLMKSDATKDLSKLLPNQVFIAAFHRAGFVVAPPRLNTGEHPVIMAMKPSVDMSESSANETLQNLLSADEATYSRQAELVNNCVNVL